MATRARNKKIIQRGVSGVEKHRITLQEADLLSDLIIRKNRSRSLALPYYGNRDENNRIIQHHRKKQSRIIQTALITRKPQLRNRFLNRVVKTNSVFDDVSNLYKSYRKYKCKAAHAARRSFAIRNMKSGRKNNRPRRKYRKCQ